MKQRNVEKKASQAERPLSKAADWELPVTPPQPAPTRLACTPHLLFILQVT